jgi:ribosomal RNA-processing protein 12
MLRHPEEQAEQVYSTTHNIASFLTVARTMQAPGSTIDGHSEAEFCKYLDLALCIAPGMSDSAMEPLLKAATMAISIPTPSAQKKAYKALSYIINERPAVFQSHFAEICSIFTEQRPVQAPARRLRLACITPIIALLYSDEAPDLSKFKLTEAETSKSAAHLVVSSLITELVLCTKEVNAKTRTQAYETLVQIAHAMHDASPPERSMETGVCLMFSVV